MKACLVGIHGWVDNEYTLRVAEQDRDCFFPVAGVLPSEADTVPKLKARGFVGVKLHPRLNRYHPLDSVELVKAAGEANLVVFLDTLFYVPGQPVVDPVITIAEILAAAPETKIVLLHAAGSRAVDLFEMGRAHPNVLLDLSLTMFRYSGSSLEWDLRFLMRELDQRVIIGSDFPEHTPQQALERFNALTHDIAEAKRDNIVRSNLERWLAS